MRIVRLTLGSPWRRRCPFCAACAGGGATGRRPAGSFRVRGGRTGRWLGPISEFTPADVPVLGGCQVFPADNPWNTDISQAPVDPNSDNYMTAMHAATTNLHPDFGSNPHYGIPVTLAPPSTPLVP